MLYPECFDYNMSSCSHSKDERMICTKREQEHCIMEKVRTVVGLLRRCPSLSSTIMWRRCKWSWHSIFFALECWFFSNKNRCCLSNLMTCLRCHWWTKHDLWWNECCNHTFVVVKKVKTLNTNVTTEVAHLDVTRVLVPDIFGPSDPESIEFNAIFDHGHHH